MIPAMFDPRPLLPIGWMAQTVDTRYGQGIVIGYVIAACGRRRERIVWLGDHARAVRPCEMRPVGRRWVRTDWPL